MSDYLTDLYTGKNKIKFIKNYPQWGLKPGPLDLQANALPTELGRNLLLRRFLKWALFVSCTTSHVGLCSFLESIEFFTIGISVRLSDRFNVTQNKINFVKNCPQWGWKPGPPDLQASALPTELSQHSVASLNLHCLYKVMLYWSCSRNEQSPTCEVVHETNKAHFRNLLTNRFLSSSVGKALAWRSGGPGFNPHWGQFLTKFFLLFPVKRSVR